LGPGILLWRRIFRGSLIRPHYLIGAWVVTAVMTTIAALSYSGDDCRAIPNSQYVAYIFMTYGTVMGISLQDGHCS